MFNSLLTTTTSGTGSWLYLIIMVVVFGGAMYFLVYRPQKKQEREANNLRNSLGVGDEVTTIGGVIGRVVSIKDETFVLETTKERTKIRFLRSALKSIDVKAAEATGVQKSDAQPESAPAEPEKPNAAETEPQVSSAESGEVILNGKKQKKNKDK